MFLGIEIGGTKLQLAVGTGDGSPPVAQLRLNVVTADGAQGILRLINSAAPALISDHDVTAVGFGFGGPVDTLRGRLVTSHQIDGWDDFPLGDWCQEQLGVPAIVQNDCNTAGLAEARFGAGEGRRVVFYVTVGTGIGGGLIVDGRIHHGGGNASAEIGHLRPGLDCDRPNATVESIASGRGIEAAARIALSARHGGERRDETEDLLARCDGDSQNLSAKQIAEAAAAENQLALGILDGPLQTLGWAVAQTVTLTAPEVVVIGGGVSLMGEKLFFEPLRRHVARYVFGPLADTFQIVPASLGEWVVTHGAMALPANAL